MQNWIFHFDERLIVFIRRIHKPLARIAIFVVFFWFGILKIFGLSPAEQLVANLLQTTIPFIPFAEFIFVFAIYEMVIGVLFLVKGWERLAIVLLMLHMLMTALPLVLLRGVTWSGIFVPTLEGQYIIKNIVIIALALTLAADLTPLKRRS